jgi:transposase
MRGHDEQQESIYSYVSPEKRIPSDHPLRRLRGMVDAALQQMSPQFAELYSHYGRASIAPEKLLRALLLQVLYSVRSERLLMEQMGYNLLFRWFVGLSMDDAVWDVTVFTKNRERLLEGEIAEVFFEQVLAQARGKELLSDEHFTVDGTLIQAWAGQKSFRAKKKEARREVPPEDPGNPTVDFHGEKRSNQTHQSTTDGQARLYKKSKGTEAKLSYLGHVLAENRNGLVVQAQVTMATGTAEREAALEMLQARRGRWRVTVGGDKGYDVHEFVADVRDLGVTPHVAQNNRNRRSAIDGRTTRHVGYQISQRKRKRVEEVFGWLKTVGLLRQTRYRGRERVGWMFTFATAVYNLVRIRNLTAEAA